MPAKEYDVGDDYKAGGNSKFANIRKAWLYLLAFLFIAIPVVVGVLVWHFVSSECKIVAIETATERPEETATASEIETENYVTHTPPEPVTVDPNIGKVWDHYRLPRDIIPSHYNLLLYPDFYEDNAWFQGREVIELEVVRPTHLILIHSRNVIIADMAIVNVDKNESIEIANNFTYIKHDYLVLEFSSPFENGTHLKLYINFEGPLGTNVGFYKSTYVSLNGEKSHVASTLFVPVEARTAFPCFDEPDFKANFTVTLKHKPGYTALSNMPEKNRVQLPDDPDLMITEFETSLRMSTYLLCVVICDFDHINTTTQYGVLIRAWGPSEVISQLNYSLELAGAVLNYFENYLKAPYPLPKQDLVLIPEFVFPGMENWGIITYAAKYMLFDRTKASRKEKQLVSMLIAHELVHNWFGNRVTQDWWSDLWLTEGFGSYFQYPGIDAHHQDWDVMTQFESVQLPLSMATVAMATDIAASSRPLIMPLDASAEYMAAFDNIAYSKGASILRMMRHFLGEENFQTSLQLYIQKYSFSNANTDDLWEIFSQIEGFSSIKTIMDTWTLQTRYPYVDVTCDTVINGSTRYIASQHLFTLQVDGHEEHVSPFDYTWYIPLDYITSDNSVSQPMIWMNRTAVTFDVEVDMDNASTWIKFNPGQMGYYRVNYPNEIWRRFAGVLQNNAEIIIDMERRNPVLAMLRPFLVKLYPRFASVGIDRSMHSLNLNFQKTIQDLDDADRANLIDDAFSLAEAGIISWTTALNLTSYMHQEQSYLPWYTFIYNIQSLGESLTKSMNYELVRQYIISKAIPIMKSLGWETITEHTDALLQEQIISLLCHLQHPECLSTASNLFRRWIDNKTDVDPNFRTAVYVHGMREVGTLDDWDKIMYLYQQETSPHEKLRLVHALSQTIYPWRITRLLDQVVHESLIEYQDVYTLLVQAISNPMGKDQVWMWIRDNWQMLVDKFALGEPSFGRAGILDVLAPSFNTEAQLKEVETLFEEYPATGVRDRRYREQILKSIRDRINEMDDDDDDGDNDGYETVRAWLRENTSSNQ